ncbi:MAG: FAD-dependent oxidoreductase [Chloroflexi bacterium]|nr:MAG: FAD-dependent oxidoreductase [Chloroflexota bacterium]
MNRRHFLRMSLAASLSGLLMGHVSHTRRRQGIKGLIIGAGIAGITAARALQNAGFDITVLEARERIGGRIWTNRSLGIPVDLGASWIQGVNNNPITELTNAFGIETFRTNFDAIDVYRPDGSRASNAELSQLENEFEEFLELAEELAEALDDDISIGRAVRIITEGEPVSPAQRWALATLIELDYAASIDDLSLFYVDSGDDFGGDSRLFPGGYDQIVDELAKGLDIRLNQPVRLIEYGDFGVRVTTDSDVFEGEGALITLPLGVLKSRRVTFAPPLPDFKQAAINRLQMGRLNKVALRFPQQFWPNDPHFISYISQRAGEFPQFMNARRFSNANLLIGFVAGRFSAALEGMPDEQVVAQAMQVLRTIFDNTIPDPDGVLVSRWGHDPFAGGSYAFIPVGATPRDLDALAEPVNETLFFAGEATNRRFAATVHGAYLSGLREAERIIAL